MVGVSGGADSTALLYLLGALAPEWRLRLHALHVDHQLREDSDADAEAARNLGRRLGVPIAVESVSVERRGSLEAAARAARYVALERHAQRIGADRIAVGHTADDQAETVLMRVLEGAGLRGLAGIPPVRGRIIRPLLAVRRRALTVMLEQAGLTWHEDPTNRDLKFFRNRLRHEILPVLAAGHDADVVGALTRVAARARDAIDALEAVAATELDRLARDDGDALTLPRDELTALPHPVAAEVLRQAAARLGSRAPLRAWAHRGLARILASPAPRRALRLGGVIIEVSGALMRLERARPRPLPARSVTVPGAVALPEIGLLFEARLLPAAGYAVPAQRDRVAFDADLVDGFLVVRRRRRGDRFHPFGAISERRLKTFLIDAKVPRWERDRVPLVDVADSIIWVGGLRRGAQAPITARSRRILELHLRPLVK
ncbi:MAG: tRNA lysidine(34) synthetase TilS [Candidatus Rokuibacteriota bacterium]